MTKRKRKNSSHPRIINRIGIVFLLVALLIGCYFFLKQENKLPSTLENENVEKLWNHTLTETNQLKEVLLDKVEDGLESARISIEKKRKTAHKEEKTNGNKKPVSSPKKDEGANTNSIQSIDNKTNLRPGSLNLKLEIPISTIRHDGIILKRMAYTTSYNKEMRNPNWVAWELTRKETTGTQERSNKFLPDPDLNEPKAKSSDYTHTGYDRGHMAPAADMKWSSQAMEESFYMSNICPQNKNLNRGDWNDLEDACRAWAKKYGTIYIACGPIYDNSSPKRIGLNKIAVPDRFFKVVLIYNRKDPLALGFIFPNRAHSQELDKYQVSVDNIEDVTGYDFFSRLPDDIEDIIEAEIRSLPSIRN